jgi:hypothetical protein
VNYGAKDANSKEAMGLVIFIVGLVLIAAGWAYGVSVLQPLLVLLGLIGFVGGFVVLRAAKGES